MQNLLSVKPHPWLNIREMTKAQKLTKLLQSKGYKSKLIWINPNGMGGLDGYTLEEEGKIANDLPSGHRRWFGYSFTQAVKEVERLPALHPVT